MLLELVLPPALTSGSTLHRVRCDPHRPPAQHRAASGSSLARKAQKAEAWLQSLPTASTKAGAQVLHPHSCSRTQSICVEGKCCQFLNLPAKAVGEHLGSVHPSARQHTLGTGSRLVPEHLPSRVSPAVSCRGGEQQGLGGGESSHPRCSGLLLGPPRALCPGGTQEQGRDLDISLPAADIEAESAFNVRAAENSSHSLGNLHLKGTGAPGPPARARRSLAQLIPPAHPSAWLCRGADSGEPPPPCSQARARGHCGAALLAWISLALGQPWVSQPCHCRFHR